MKPNWIALGAVWAALAVGLGAFGAHALKARVSAEDLDIWKTAVLYHALHALGLVLYGVFAERRSLGSLPAFALGIGSVVFSASLYAMVLGGPRWLGAVTPFGGVGMIVGWIAFAVQSWRSRTASR